MSIQYWVLVALLVLCIAELGSKRQVQHFFGEFLSTCICSWLSPLDGFSLRSLQHNIRRVFIFFSRSEVPIFSFSSPIAWQEYCNRKDYN